MGRAKPAKKLEPLSVRLDPDVRKAIEALAKAEERSLSDYINRALRQHSSGSTVELRDSVREALERLAKADKRSLADYVEIVLEQHIERTRVSPKRTKPERQS
jgi:predicted HicB family RNase H-like nuclease